MVITAQPSRIMVRAFQSLKKVIQMSFFFFFLNNLRLGLLFLTETFQNVGVKKHLRGKEGIIRNVVSSTFEVQSLLGSKSPNITAPAASAFTVYRCVILNRWSLYPLSTHHKQVLFLMDHFV